jgi:hypothetical protein
MQEMGQAYSGTRGLFFNRNALFPTMLRRNIYDPRQSYGENMYGHLRQGATTFGRLAGGANDFRKDVTLSNIGRGTQALAGDAWGAARQVPGVIGGMGRELGKGLNQTFNRGNWMGETATGAGIMAGQAKDWTGRQLGRVGSAIVNNPVARGIGSIGRGIGNVGYNIGNAVGSAVKNTATGFGELGSDLGSAFRGGYNG